MITILSARPYSKMPRASAKTTASKKSRKEKSASEEVIENEASSSDLSLKEESEASEVTLVVEKPKKGKSSKKTKPVVVEPESSEEEKPKKGKKARKSKKEPSEEESTEPVVEKAGKIARVPPQDLADAEIGAWAEADADSSEEHAWKDEEVEDDDSTQKSEHSKVAHNDQTAKKQEQAAAAKERYAVIAATPMGELSILDQLAYMKHLGVISCNPTLRNGIDALEYQLVHGDGGIAPIAGQSRNANRARGNSGNSRGNKQSGGNGMNRSKPQSQILGRAVPDTSAKPAVRRSQAQADCIPAHLY